MTNFQTEKVTLEKTTKFELDKIQFMYLVKKARRNAVETREFGYVVGLRVTVEKARDSNKLICQAARLSRGGHRTVYGYGRIHDGWVRIRSTPYPYRIN